MRWLRGLKEHLAPRRRLVVHDDDSLPDKLPRRDLVVARDDGEDWAAGLMCPCGCGAVLELMLIAEARPNWKLSVDHRGRPSLYPSIWRDTGCRSHFWLHRGRVRWCD